MQEQDQGQEDGVPSTTVAEGLANQIQDVEGVDHARMVGLAVVGLLATFALLAFMIW